MTKNQLKALERACLVWFWICVVLTLILRVDWELERLPVQTGVLKFLLGCGFILLIVGTAVGAVRNAE